MFYLNLPIYYNDWNYYRRNYTTHKYLKKQALNAIELDCISVVIESRIDPIPFYALEICGINLIGDPDIFIF
jgi:hypothetical protein